MSDKKAAAQGSAATGPAIKFPQMSPIQKGILLLKLLGFILTFGFAFPTVIEDF